MVSSPPFQGTVIQDRSKFRQLTRRLPSYLPMCPTHVQVTTCLLSLHPEQRQKKCVKRPESLKDI